MQLRLPWWSTEEEPGDRRVPVSGRAGSVRTTGRRTGPPSIDVGGERLDLEIARHRFARRYVLRVAPDGHLRLTVPRGASIAGGVRFAERQTEWIVRERQRQRDRDQPWTTGTTVWWRGDRVSLVHDGGLLRCGDEIVRVRASATVRDTLERHWRRVAEIELTPRCWALARETRVTITRVSVRNQKSRWGACSARGAITLNWRLVQMPPHVSDYILFHELMHRRQPNHSRRFWREVESVCPGWREAERWLRKFGKELL